MSRGCRESIANRGIFAGGEWIAWLVRLVDALVPLPRHNVQVPLPADLIPLDQARVGKRLQPFGNPRESVARVSHHVIGEQLADDQRDSIEPDPVVIDVRPEHLKQEPVEVGQGGDVRRLVEL